MKNNQEFKLPKYCDRRANGKIRYKPRGGKSVLLDVPANASEHQVLMAYDTLVIQSNPYSLKYLFESYQKSPRWIRLADRSKECYTHYFGSLNRVFGNANMADVRTSDFVKWRDERAFGKNGAPTQAMKELKFLKLLLRHASEYELLGRSYVNQMVLVQNPIIPEETKITSKKLMSKEMFFTILDTAPPEIKVAAMLSYITGLRLGDIIDLKKEDVTKSGALLRIQNKTGAQVLKSNTGALIQTLDAAYELPGHQANMFTPYLIPNSRGRKYTASGFTSVWQRARLRAYPDGGAPEGYRTRFHDIRHRGTTDFDGESKADFTGHKGDGRERMAAHYDDNNNLPINSPSLDIEIPKGIFH